MPFLNDLVDANKAKLKAEGHSHAPKKGDVEDSLVSRYVLDLGYVKGVLEKQIKGQEHAIEAILNSLKIVKTGLRKTDKPLFVALLVGPTGVGKTQIVRALSEAIWGDPDSFCRVDMNTLSQEHYAASLTGPPPGYVGSKEGHTILNKDKIQGTYSKPGVVLFDEIEKASGTVIQALLNVFDNGYMQIASGTGSVDFRNSLIFMSSNIGARKIITYHNKNLLLNRLFNMFGVSRADEDRILAVIHDDLNRRFEPEFINRIDKIIAFNWLGQEAVQAIARKELEELNQRVRKLGADLHYDDEVVDFVARTGFDENYGARAIYRAIQVSVERRLADVIIDRPPTQNGMTAYHVKVLGGELSVTVSEGDA